MRSLDPTVLRRILIRAPNWIGDAVMATPAVRAARSAFPDARLVVLAKPWVVPVYKGSPDVDEVLPYDAREGHAGWRGKLALVNDLRKRRFHLAVLLQNAFEPALLTLLARIPRRMGYASDGRGPLLTHAVRLGVREKRVHQIDYYLNLLKRAGLRADDRTLRLAIAPGERREALALLRNLGGPDDGAGRVGINPGAAFGGAKRWPADRYAEVCRGLVRDFGVRVLVFGGPGEKALGDRIRGEVGIRCVNLCGATTLRRAMALIGCCDLFITNDSGLMHVAAALEIPQIAVFGPTDRRTTSPAGPHAEMIWHPTPCAPCMKPECPIDHRCMAGVTVDRVLASARKSLLRHGRKGSS